jgi:hypothetical protein
VQADGFGPAFELFVPRFVVVSVERLLAGGSLESDSEPGGGTYISDPLPLRDRLNENANSSSFWSGQGPGYDPGHCPERIRDPCPMERPQVFGVVCPVAKVV